MTMKHRFTVETLASGQPRAYADHLHHVRVTFEAMPWNSKSGEIEPCFVSEDAAIRMLENMPLAGFIRKAPAEWYDRRLEWLRPIDGKPASEVIPHGDPKQICASVWEFQTRTPFTD